MERVEGSSDGSNSPLAPEIGAGHAIEVAGADLAFRHVNVPRHDVTGRGIAHAAGLEPPDVSAVRAHETD